MAKDDRSHESDASRPDALPPHTQSLTDDMQAALEAAGGLSYKQLEIRAAGSLSKATLSRILSSNPKARENSLPDWSYYERFLTALGNDPEPYRTSWENAQQEWKEWKSALNQGTQSHQSGESEAAGAGSRLSRRSTVTWIALAVIVAAIAVWQLPKLWSASSPGAPPTTTAGAALTAAPVTGTPPPTVPGTITRTYNAAQQRPIGVRVFPTPSSPAGGAQGPTDDGVTVDVVCHWLTGRSVDEHLDTSHPTSRGWYEIVFNNRFWYVSDHYVAFPAGVQVPTCPA